MKTYSARVFGNISVSDGSKITSNLNPRLDLRNHSPTGFSWGYNGSGCAQTALAILCDVTDDETALEFYQEFKNRVIARIPQTSVFTITAAEVLSHIETMKWDRAKRSEVRA